MNETKDFAEFLTDLRGGTAHHELSNGLLEVTKAVQKTGKMGTIQLTVKVKPIGEGQVEITDQIKKTVPEPTKPTTFMFVDDEYNLTRNNPRQGEIFNLKVVDKETGEIKEVGSGK